MIDYIMWLLSEGQEEELEEEDVFVPAVETGKRKRWFWQKPGRDNAERGQSVPIEASREWSAEPGPAPKQARETVQQGEVEEFAPPSRAEVRWTDGLRGTKRRIDEPYTALTAQAGQASGQTTEAGRVAERGLGPAQATQQEAFSRLEAGAGAVRTESAGELFIQQMGRARSVALYTEKMSQVPAVSVAEIEAGASALPDLLAIDRCFERDARRYDGGSSTG